jgi:hypothetical protein
MDERDYKNENEGRPEGGMTKRRSSLRMLKAIRRDGGTADAGAMRKVGE